MRIQSKALQRDAGIVECVKTKTYCGNVYRNFYKEFEKNRSKTPIKKQKILIRTTPAVEISHLQNFFFEIKKI